jgi:hypothetical protein
MNQVGSIFSLSPCIRAKDVPTQYLTKPRIRTWNLLYLIGKESEYIYNVFCNVAKVAIIRKDEKMFKGAKERCWMSIITSINYKFIYVLLFEIMAILASC